MYRQHHNGQLSIEQFHIPFGGTLDPGNRWVIFSSLMPWEELEETYAPQVQPHHWRPCKARKPGLRCTLYQAETWLDRRGDC